MLKKIFILLFLNVVFCPEYMILANSNSLPSSTFEDYPKLNLSFSKWYNAVDWSGGSNFEALSENINVVVSRDYVEVWVGSSLDIKYEVLASQIESIEGQSVKTYLFTDGSLAIFYRLSDGTDAVLFEDGGSHQNLVWID